MLRSSLLSVCRLSALMIIAGGFSSAATASPIELVIDRTPELTDNFSNPDSFLEINGVLYFSASDGINNSELWRTDGTQAGTYKVREINPRGGQLGGSNGSDPRFFFNANGTLYFVASTQETGAEVWKSDGTKDGTVLLKDTAPGPTSGVRIDPNFTVFRGEVYFVGNNSLYKTNGTPQGTVRVKINDDPDSPLNIGISDVQESGGNLYFSCPGGLNRGVWRLDDGPDKLIQVSPFQDWFNADTLTDVNGKLFCLIDNRRQLASVGTTTNSGVLLTIRMQSISSLSPLNNKLVCYAKDVDNPNTPILNDGIGNIYISDGTLAGTSILTNDTDGNVGMAPNSVFNGLLYFSKADGAPQGIPHLAVTDGTVAGTRLVLQPPGANYTMYNGRLYYTYGYFMHGDSYSTVYTTDGTQAGTYRVSESLYGALTGFGVAGNRLFFGGSTQSWGGGTNLWSIGPDGQPSPFQSISSQVKSTVGAEDSGVAFNGKYYYTDRFRPAHLSIFPVKMTDGTAAGSSSYDDGIIRSVLGTANGRLFLGNNTGGLMASLSGIPGEEVPLGINIPLPTDAGYEPFVAWNNRALVANTSKVYVTDGTPAGTTDLVNSGGTSYRWQMTPLSANRAVLRQQRYDRQTREPGVSRELWITDGTAAGTVNLLNLPSSQDMSPVMVSGGVAMAVVYESIYDISKKGKLWATDGTPTGFSVVTGSPDFHDVHVIGANATNAVFLSVPPGGASSEVWSYNVITQTFTQLGNLYAYGAGVLFNDVVYFAADDGQHGIELWRTDGTVGGTQLVEDVIPGQGSSFPSQLTAIGNYLFMAMDHPSAGYELFAMRTGESKPWLVTNLNPGEAPSTPNNFNATGNTMFMFADNGTSGQEVFKVNLQNLEPFTHAKDWCLFE